MIFETKRLIIRPVTLNDRIEIFEYRRNKEINKYQGWIPETIEDVEVFIGKIAKKIDEPMTWFQFAIIEKATEKIIGDVGIQFFDNENRQVEIGCTLNQDFQNKGYATETIKRIVDYLFGELNKQKVIASIDPDNKSSIRLVERIGFRRETHAVERFFVNEKWVDDLIYVLTKSNWADLNY
jgi:RimJ/RimL family protein N-acetyltransferase